MTVTLWKILWKVEDLWYNSWLDIDECIIYDFVETIKSIVINMLGLQEWYNWNEEYELPTSIEVNNDTLFSISNEIDAVIAEDNLFANFEALVWDDYAEYFEAITKVYDESWINWIKEYVIEISNNIPIDTPLYKLIQLILKWKDLPESMLIILSENWIDINKNPIVHLPNKVGEYIRSIRDYISWLITWNNSSFIFTYGSASIN